MCYKNCACDLFPWFPAEEILNEYRDRFILEMDSSSIALDLLHHGIIPDGALESLANAHGQRQRNSILYDCLLRTCTNEALKTACGIITSVQGNPRMSALGKDMQRRLESGACACARVCARGVCACMCACMCVCALVHVCVCMCV